MAHDPEHRFIGAIPERLADFVDGTGRTILEDGLYTALQIQDGSSSFLASFHTGLVIGVDVHQLAVETNCTLKQADQRAETARIKRAW